MQERRKDTKKNKENRKVRTAKLIDTRIYWKS